jgi:hypothetical protein
MNKKAQIPTTITWFPATIIIFLIVLVFLLFVSMMTGIKYISGGDSFSTSLSNSFSKNELGFFLQQNNFELENKIYAWAVAYDSCLSEKKNCITEESLRKEIEKMLEQDITSSVDYAKVNTLKTNLLMNFYLEYRGVIISPLDGGGSSLPIGSFILLPFKEKQISIYSRVGEMFS